MNTEQFNKLINERRSIRKFDTNHLMPKEVVKKSIERAILSANSSNMQLWEFYRIKSNSAKKDVAEICLSQNAAKTANELVVFVARPDLWKSRQQDLLANFAQTMPDKNERKAKMVYDYYEKWIPMLYGAKVPFIDKLVKYALILKNKNKPFMRDIFKRDIPIITHKSVALAAQTFMLSIQAEGYNSCPMEGLDSYRLKKYLNLPKKAEITMVVAVGKGLPEGVYGKRFRIPNEKVFFEL